MRPKKLLIYYIIENNTNGAIDIIPTYIVQWTEYSRILFIKKQYKENQPKCVTMELFDTFYDDYAEYKHYINDILKNFRKNVLNEQWEIKCETSCKKKKLNHWKTKLIDSRLKIRGY